MPSASEQTALRVSVIIPTYNRAGYLRGALNSVFGQSLPPWEVIVVDDGSTDETAGVVDSYGSSVRYARHSQNQGISAARNTGISTARGDIIAWLDSDDLWKPDHLATVIPLLVDDESIDGVHTGLIRIDEQGNTLAQVGCRTVPPEELSSSLVESCHIQTSTFVARKCCYEQAGTFDTRFGICEDYDMFVRIAKRHRILGVPSRTVKYRVHTHNTVADPARYSEYRLALTEKHYGEDDGVTENWSQEKRTAYGYAYRAVALKWIEHGCSTEGWRLLRRAAHSFPGLLRCVDTFYELACGDQPMGYRGSTEGFDIKRNGTEVMGHLQNLFAGASPEVAALQKVAYAKTYLALAMLSDQAGQWSQARHYIVRAIHAHPGLLRDMGTARRLGKLLAGKRIVDSLRRLLPPGHHPPLRETEA